MAWLHHVVLLWRHHGCPLKSIIASLLLACIAVSAAAQDRAQPEMSRAVPAPVIDGNTQIYTLANKPDGFIDGYPVEAQEHEVEGPVTVVCQVDDNLQVTRCVVTEESPPGFGLGKQTALMILGHQVHTDRIKPGEWFQLRWIWTLGA